MKRNLSIILLLILASLVLFYFASSEPSEIVLTETPTDKSTLAVENTPENRPTVFFMLTNTTLTAEMGLTMTAIPSSTPPPWATIIPATGDLGWGSVHGIIIDGATNLPLEGAAVTCVHSSDTSPYLCNGTTTTNVDGIYAFTSAFFRETDRVTLIVEAPGYFPLHFELGISTSADFRFDLGFFPDPIGTFTPTPFIMCTPPACLDGVLVCGDTNGCMGGCGAICLPWTATP